MMLLQHQNKVIAASRHGHSIIKQDEHYKIIKMSCHGIIKMSVIKLSRQFYHH
jgi:hypothetical protein